MCAQGGVHAKLRARSRDMREVRATSSPGWPQPLYEAEDDLNLHLLLARSIGVYDHMVVCGARDQA